MGADPTLAKATDLAKHLRTTHLVLVGVSLAVSVPSLSREDRDVELAAADLAEIRDFTSVTGSRWGWLQDHIDDEVVPRLITAGPPRSRYYRLGTTVADRSIVVYAPNLRSYWTANPPHSDWYWAKFRDDVLRAPVPATLAGFRILWNAIDSVFLYQPVNPIWFASVESFSLFGRSDSNRLLSYSVIDSVDVRPEDVLYTPDTLIWVTDSTLPDTVWALAGSSHLHALQLQLSDNDDTRYRIRLMFRPSRFVHNAREAFSGKWGLDSYSDEFPELYKITSLYDSLTFRQLDAVLRSEATRSRNPVRVLTADLPPEDLARFGVPILVGLQLYLGVNLLLLLGMVTSHESTDEETRPTESLEVTWIGAGAGLTGWGVTMVSGAVFPTVAGITLLQTFVQADWSPLVAYGQFFWLLFGAWLAFLLWRLRHPRLRVVMEAA